MLEQLDLFSAIPAQEVKPEEKLMSAVTERRLRPPVVVLAPEPEADIPQPVTVTVAPAPPQAKTATELPKVEQPVPVDPEPVKIEAEKPDRKSSRGRKSIREMSLETARIDIPADDILYQKQYYGIGEVATMFQVNASLLRYWESEFDILKPRKNRKGDRFFRPDDIKNLQRIHHLLRERKYTIEGARAFLKASKKAGSAFEAVESLKKLKEFLLELRAGLS
jgi:DNA-binding transcriptional MerR regulator